MQNEKLDDVVLKKLNLNNIKSSKLDNWNAFVKKIKNPSNEVSIGLMVNTLNYKIHTNQF